MSSAPSDELSMTAAELGEELRSSFGTNREQISAKFGIRPEEIDTDYAKMFDDLSHSTTISEVRKAVQWQKNRTHGFTSMLGRTLLPGSKRRELWDTLSGLSYGQDKSQYVLPAWPNTLESFASQLNTTAKIRKGYNASEQLPSLDPETAFALTAALRRGTGYNRS